MLAQRSGQSDILVGTPVAGRNRSETEPLVGCFVNTLVLRTCIDEHWTALDLVKAVRDTCLEAFGNNELPFEKLVAELRPERDLSRPPLAQAFFVLQNARSSSLNLPSIQVEALPLASATSKFEFSVDAFDTGNGLGLFFDYNPDLFSPASVQRMAHHFEAALDSIARNPETRLSDLPLLTEAERQQIVVGWNRTEVVHEGTGNTAQRILAQAAQTPTRIAIGFEGREVSYAELGQATEAIARKLRAVGVQPDTLTGVCLHRSPEMVIAALAVMHAGGAYVPLDPGFPPERLQYMLADSEATVLLTQASLRDEFAGFNGQVLCVEDLLADNEQSPAQDWAPAASDHLAYVIYTSGSTGKPKGVAIPQGALVNLLLSMRQTPGIAADDVLLAVTTLSFDIAGLELFLPLIAGARVELVSRDTAMNGERLAELLSANSISLMQATPATWRMVIDAGWQGSAGLKVLTGGEPLSPELRAELLRRCQSVWNVYGPTETTIWSTVERVLDEPGPVLIGRPIANTTIYILDRHGRPVPVGVSGELHIGGQGLARGYWKRQELTEEKFVWYTPMPGAPAERIYRTGDLARYRADGRIECLGRIDSQVKVRGYRIELGEIESVLRQQEGVQEAVVLAQEDAGGEKRLVAYLLAETGGGTLDTATLRAHAGRTLPDYMVPSAFVQLQQLPLTPNGKIDRKALRTEQPLAAPVAMQYAAPESDAEATIAAIWAELLRIPQVGRKDNFFDLGGHSLLLAKVHSRVRAAFPATDLSITEMFKYPTVTSLAERVARTASPSASNLGHRAELRRHAAAARLQD
jgi:amino acid adenylation domain-containing protein